MITEQRQNDLNNHSDNADHASDQKPFQTPYLARIKLNGVESGSPEAATHGTSGKVLLSAINLFATRGYNACSMREIAKAVNIGAPAIYNHYDAKTDILIAALDYVLSTFYAAILKHPIPRAPENALFCVLRRHVLFAVMNRTFARAAASLLNPELMMRELPDEARVKYTQAMKEYRLILKELIEQTIPHDAKIDTALQVFLVHQIVDRAGEWYEPDSPLDPADVADQTLELVARMLKLPSK
ncbi:TetR/AcrR family transcriptional regulator [Rouxiella badensis]|uniref:TetR/AcrR family transcriptional regulator n=1 Tax=Rouxiella badensis TaxID=1646377 RepID=UPI0022AA36E2|nr:TetR/AcrR family transcriptional regulator [Rouxiella badensis]WAT09669.1 TetR/AcrR family transcriptional regulator [Rouxiella badensis]